jgi:signal transduction histidine kinase
MKDWVPTFSRPAFRRREFALLVLALAALLIILFGRIQESRDIAQSRQSVAHAVVALQSVENITTLVLRAETAQRGFLLTGSKTYLPPYQSTAREIAAAIRDFDRAADSVGLDVRYVKALKTLTAAKLQEVTQVLDLYNDRGSGPALALIRTNTGLHLMTDIWDVSGRLKAECVQRFTAESDRLAKQNQSALWTSVAGIAVVLSVIALATVRLAQSFRRNAELIMQYADSVEDYKLLARRLESIREEERAHLAREIHDVLGQTLTVIKLDVATAARKMGTADMTVAAAKLNQVTGTVDTAIRTLRQVAKELRPPLLDAAGFAVALQAYVAELQEHTGLRIHLTVLTDLPQLGPEQTITAFRICQEALTNVIRHAHATEATIDISSDSKDVIVTIHDDGQGFALQAAGQKRSLGLLGMEERAELVAGHVRVDSEPGRGTTVTFCMPLRLPATVD